MPRKDREARLEAQRQHYRDNKAAYQARAKQQKEIIKLEIRAAKDKPCADCGKKYPFYVMQFDHLEDKLGGISKLMSNRQIAKARIEIAKCEVVCANCHAERTYQRQRA